jgi:hypothetical protein
VLYPASRLDWLVLARLGAATIANIPGDSKGVTAKPLHALDVILVHRLAPLVLLGAAIGVVVLAVSGRWGVQAEPAATRLQPQTPARTRRPDPRLWGGKTR